MYVYRTEDYDRLLGITSTPSILEKNIIYITIGLWFYSIEFRVKLRKRR